MILMSGGSAVILPDTASRPAKPSSQQAVVDLRNALIKVYPYSGTLPPWPDSPRRPLLLQNGRRDVVATPEKVKFLFEAAEEPKQLRWYDSGHTLPGQAYRDAAEWLRQHWSPTVSRPS